MRRKTKRHQPPQSHSPGVAKRMATVTAGHVVSGPTPQSPRPYALLAVCGLLLLAVALIFGKTLRYDFVNFDDDILVYENPMVARGLTAQGVALGLHHQRGQHVVSADLDLLHAG